MYSIVSNMPNIQCDKCKLYIDDICKNKKEILHFINLVHKRAQRISGIIYNVSPGITHNEVSKHKINDEQCDGIIRYHYFTYTKSIHFTPEMFHPQITHTDNDEPGCFDCFGYC